MSLSRSISSILTGKPVLKTPTKCQPKYVPRIQSKLYQSTPLIGQQSTPIIQNKMAKTANLKVIAKKLMPIIDTECNKNDSKTVENCNVNGNTETDDISGIIGDDDVTKDSSEIALALEEMKIAEPSDDEPKTSTEQPPWIDVVLKLLNTADEKLLSNKLATVGWKTAVQIKRCRDFRGEFKQLEDLQTKLGWSDKIYKKFRSSNFLD